MSLSEEFHAKEFTPVPWIYKKAPFDLQENFFLLGSCFAQEFYQALVSLGQRVFLNPFGNLFNPLSLGKAMSLLQDNGWDPRTEIFEHKGLWRHPDFHTSFADPDRNKALENHKLSLSLGKMALHKASVVIITFGTAFYYKFKETGAIWANCHELPGDRFERLRASVEEMTLMWTPLLTELKLQGKKVFLTLSPVRHLRDDPVENSLSKAILRVFIQNLLDRDLGVYFPAYEILLDELRDYRWYAEDLAHPSSQAAEYITARFWEATAGKHLKEMGLEFKTLQHRASHIPLHPHSKENLERLASESLRWEKFYKKYPKES